MESNHVVRIPERLDDSHGGVAEVFLAPTDPAALATIKFPLRFGYLRGFR
ncbi:hypothetical protein RMSM_03006 [Rhodopirellula maiorica SM1]|uniref:Uncharacterized protein n=1 Tax=Rhodopirellula maiorica SM1 TaxID=1265738 RepID=M5S1K8_9BACT|nr:hypothetical protein RMSM_03006 [Rhodopirellula maiorica SM1]